MPVVDYDAQMAAFYGCSESPPIIQKVTCYENASGIVGWQTDYWDGRSLYYGDPSLATGTQVLDIAAAPGGEMRGLTKYITQIEASYSDTQLGYIQFYTNEGLGLEFTCGVTNGANPVEIL